MYVHTYTYVCVCVCVCVCVLIILILSKHGILMTFLTSQLTTTFTMHNAYKADF